LSKANFFNRIFTLTPFKTVIKLPAFHILFK